jgi:hypothetical protein
MSLKMVGRFLGHTSQRISTEDADARLVRVPVRYKALDVLEFVEQIGSKNAPSGVVEGGDAGEGDCGGATGIGA